MITHSLKGGWTLTLERPAEGAPEALTGTTAPATVPATVPGCVHTDLLAAGLIEDPYLDINEANAQWIGESDWRYSRRLEIADAWRDEDRVELVFDGLDTVAEVRLDDRVLGRTRNQHRRYRFDLGPALPSAEATLRIDFASAMSAARAEAARLGDRPRAYGPPFNFIRKAACNFGWDWGPTLVTAGVWREARVEAWSCARLARVRPLVRLQRWPIGRSDTPLTASPPRPGEGAHAGPDDGAERPAGEPPEAEGARTAGVSSLPQARGGATGPNPDGSVEVAVQLERAGAEQALHLSARLLGPDGRPVADAGQAIGADARNATLTLAVPQPAVWWPRGYGAQPLYTLELELARANGGAPLDRWRRRIGFRNAALDASPDAQGRAFTLVVNGRPIFAKGVNWIPDDVFPSRVGADRYGERLRQALDAGVNLVRVWGGGIYEDDAFFDACDELGLLVWQDFAFACAAYPEEPPFPGEIEAEAEDAIERLMPHPSLVLYNGNNENLWGYEDWGWKPRLQGRSWGRGYYLHTLPRLVAALDPTRPYWPGSPWSGSEDVHPNDDRHGCMHIWDAWNEADYSVYLEKRPRFVSEFGHQGPAAYATVARAISERPLRADGPAMLHHQKAVGGNEKLERRLAEHFPVPREFDAWHFATQLNQARAVELGVRHFRSLAPACMGAVVWQLNDCWPVTSWAAVDGDGRRKPLWYALRRVYAPRLLSLLPGGGQAGVAQPGVAQPGVAQPGVAQPGDDPAGAGGAAPRPGGTHEGGAPTVRLALHNDTDDPWEARVRLRRAGLRGGVLAETSIELAVEPRGVRTVTVRAPLATPEDPLAELLIADEGGQRAVYAFGRDRDLRYLPAALDAALETRGPDHRLTVTARAVLRDLTLQPDRLQPSAAADDALVTLLPGERHTFVITSPTPLTLEDLTRTPVLWCANDLLAPRERA